MACRSRSRSPSRGLEEAVQKIKQSFYSQQVTLQDNYCKKYIVVCCVNYSLDLPKDLELFLRNYHKGKDDEGRKNMYKANLRATLGKSIRQVELKSYEWLFLF